MWKIALLERAGRINFTGRVHAWTQKALPQPGISPISCFGIQPIVRILVAFARIEKLIFVTSDKAILAFAKVTSLACLRA